MWWQTLLVIFLSLMALFATGLPIFACFMILNVVTIFYLIGAGGLGLFVNSMLETSTSDPLVAIPMFVLLGELLFRTGGVQVLFEAFDGLIGRVRGRLYIVAVLVAAFMGAISGSALASVAVLGRFVYPTMVARGCDRKLAMGTILSGATPASPNTADGCPPTAGRPRPSSAAASGPMTSRITTSRRGT